MPELITTINGIEIGTAQSPWEVVASREEAANFLKVSPKTITRMKAEGRLIMLKIYKKDARDWFSESGPEHWERIFGESNFKYILYMPKPFIHDWDRPTDLIYNKSDAAKRLGVDRRTIYKLIKQDRLKFERGESKGGTSGEFITEEQIRVYETVEYYRAFLKKQNRKSVTDSVTRSQIGIDKLL